MGAIRKSDHSKDLLAFQHMHAVAKSMKNRRSQSASIFQVGCSNHVAAQPSRSFYRLGRRTFADQSNRGCEHGRPPRRFANSLSDLTEVSTQNLLSGNVSLRHRDLQDPLGLLEVLLKAVVAFEKFLGSLAESGT